MATTVRLDKQQEEKLAKVANVLHKKKSEVLRDALDYYAEYVISQKKVHFKKIVDKVKEADFEAYKTYEGMIDDAYER